MKLAMVDLGRMAYDTALRLQEDMLQERATGGIQDTLIFVEHDPVYTLGRNADPANITASTADLEALGIAVRRTTRGGEVTYHGPGQITGYPIINLREHGQGVLWFVASIEHVLIETLAAFGVTAVTDTINRGVWVGQDKIAAIGVRVSRQITMHGFALNVCTDLSHYAGIVPCGIRERGVTSLDRLVPGITMDDVKPVLSDRFRQVFGYEETP